MINKGVVTREEGLAFADSPTNLLWRLANQSDKPSSRQPPKPEEPDPPRFSEIILDVRPEEAKLQTNFGRLVERRHSIGEREHRPSIGSRR